MIASLYITSLVGEWLEGFRISVQKYCVYDFLEIDECYLFFFTFVFCSLEVSSVVRLVLWHKIDVIQIQLIFSFIVYITVLMINGCMHVVGCRVVLIYRGIHLFQIHLGLLNLLFPSLNYVPKTLFP